MRFPSGAPDSMANPTQRIAYIYRAPTAVRGSKIRVIWGRVTRTHGNSGVVRSKFNHNIPPHAFGASVRVLLYPSNSALLYLACVDRQTDMTQSKYAPADTTGMTRVYATYLYPVPSTA